MGSCWEQLGLDPAWILLEAWLAHTSEPFPSSRGKDTQVFIHHYHPSLLKDGQLQGTADQAPQPDTLQKTDAEHGQQPPGDCQGGLRGSSKCPVYPVPLCAHKYPCPSHPHSHTRTHSHHHTHILMLSHAHLCTHPHHSPSSPHLGPLLLTTCSRFGPEKQGTWACHPPEWPILLAMGSPVPHPALGVPAP